MPSSVDIISFDIHNSVSSMLGSKNKVNIVPLPAGRISPEKDIPTTFPVLLLTDTSPKSDNAPTNVTPLILN